MTGQHRAGSVSGGTGPDRPWVSRLRRIGLLLVAPVGLLVLAAAVAPVAFAQSSQPPFSAYRVPGSQVVYVSGVKGSTYAAFQLWQRDRQGWKRTLAGTARVGRNGISPNASESSRYTPAGMFTLTEAFGHKTNPGGRLYYRYVAKSNSWWWVSDTRSKYYNKPYWCPPAQCPFDTSKGENLGQVGPVYDYAVVMNYNRSPVVPGKGSAFFIHIANTLPTAGCVSTSQPAVLAMMRWLDPKQHPVIITRTT